MDRTMKTSSPKTQKNRVLIYSKLIATAAFLMLIGSSITLTAEFFIGSGGTGILGDPYLISNAGDLRELDYRINDERRDYTNTYFKLMNDITTPITQPIGRTRAFKGIFNGNNKTITINVNISTGNYVGVFGFTENAEIYNLTVTGRIQLNNDYTGAIVGYAYNTIIDSCINKATVYAPNNYYVGGIAGWAESSTISNCRNDGYVQGHSLVGGIVGLSMNTQISFCTNSKPATIITTNNGSSYFGGIAGAFGVESYNESVSIANCVNSSNINVPNADYVGGIIGMNYNYNSPIYTYATNNSNSGSIRGRQNVGGIIGGTDNYNTAYINKVTNIGGVYGTQNVGGIIGNSRHVNLSNALNAGFISGNQGITLSRYVAGIVGNAGYSSTIQKCLNVGYIYDEGANHLNIGAIIGNSYNQSMFQLSSITVSNCFYDKQICRFKAIGDQDVSIGATKALGYNTNKLIGSTSSNILFNPFEGSLGIWTFNTTTYPRLGSTPIDYVAASPIYIGNDEHVNSITQDFTASRVNGVHWDTKFGSVVSVTQPTNTTYWTMNILTRRADTLFARSGGSGEYFKFFPIRTLPKLEVTHFTPSQEAPLPGLPIKTINMNWLTSDDAKGVVVYITRNSNSINNINDDHWKNALDNINMRNRTDIDVTNGGFVVFDNSNSIMPNFGYGTALATISDYYYFYTKAYYEDYKTMGEMKSWSPKYISKINLTEENITSSSLTGELFEVGKVSPAPAEDEASFKVNVGSEDGYMTINVYDLTGAKIMELANNEFVTAGSEMTIPMNLSNLPSGIYTINVTVGTKNAVVTFIKQQ